MVVVTPAKEHLASYVAALERGWSADTQRGALAAREELDRIRADPDAFLAAMTDRDANGGPVTLPDGTQVARLPGLRRFLWDGEFCGSIGLRWQRGTTALPPHCLGHIGYAVVPWKQRLGFATLALAHMLQQARDEGLAHVTITTDPDNVASQRVIVANGGVLVECFVKPVQFGAKPGLRYRVDLAPRGQAGPDLFGGDRNGSMPAATVVPVLQYPDVVEAAAWLGRAFGFAERLRIGTHRIQMAVGEGALVLAQAPRQDATSSVGSPRDEGAVRHSVMVRVRDARGHHDAAVRAGARITGAVADQPYGERQYTALDLSGHAWTFSQTLRDTEPAAWGGTLVEGVPT